MNRGTTTSLPERIGRYRLVEPLGQGGMGTVVAAVLEGPGGFEKEVALKVLRPEVADDPAARRALAREARLGARLSHPNLVDVYAFGEEDGWAWFAMERVHGPTASQLLKRGGPLPPRAALELVRQAATGLAHAHEAPLADGTVGLVHRDLKPSNLMVDRSGLVKVADLGIARQVGTGEGVQGTRGYMSPEQCDGLPCTPQSDLFSLALVLWTLLTGRSPLRRRTAAATFIATARVEALLADGEAVAPLDRRVPGLGSLLVDCLRYEPEDRVEEASTLARRVLALERVAEGPSLVQLVWGEGLDELPVQVTGETTNDGSLPPVVLPPLPATDGPLVGRKQALGQLKEALGTGVVVVSGPAGVGKSRLVREAMADGAPVLRVDLADAGGGSVQGRTVGEAVAATLGLPAGDDGDEGMVEQLITALQGQPSPPRVWFDNGDRVRQPWRSGSSDCRRRAIRWW